MVNKIRINQIVDAVGLRKNILNNWICAKQGPRRHTITLYGQKGYSGGWREFPEEDVKKLIILADLYRLGIPLNKAERFADLFSMRKVSSVRNVCIEIKINKKALDKKWRKICQDAE